MPPNIVPLREENPALKTPDKQDTTGVTPGYKLDKNKPRFDLLPPNPLFEVAKVFTLGASRYGDRNWETGMRWGRVFAALMRHAWRWLRGESRDEDGLHHLACVAFCALALMEYETTHPELDDRSKR
jgi:hypothetical protein